MASSSCISRTNASDSDSPASMPPPGRQSFPGAATVIDRRMINNRCWRKITPTTPWRRAVVGFGSFMAMLLADIFSDDNCWKPTKHSFRENYETTSTLPSINSSAVLNHTNRIASSRAS